LKYGDEGNVAKLAFEGNFGMEDVVKIVKSGDAVSDIGAHSSHRTNFLPNTSRMDLVGCGTNIC